MDCDVKLYVRSAKWHHGVVVNNAGNEKAHTQEYEMRDFLKQKVSFHVLSLENTRTMSSSINAITQSAT